MLKFSQWKGKDKWLFLLTIGIILCILAFPAEKVFGKKGREASESVHAIGDSAKRAGLADNWENIGIGGNPNHEQVYGKEEVREVFANVKESYEKELEERVKEILRHVDGVGNVDVMIVLKSSAEKIWQTDVSSTSSLTEEKQENGSSRRIVNQTADSSTVGTGTYGAESPMLTKELFPEISGIVISADGGGNPAVQKEISSAMEALFGLPAHKIKVLKRVE